MALPRERLAYVVNEPVARLLRPMLFMDLRGRVPDRCVGDSKPRDEIKSSGRSGVT
jgi:hypothetical protein